MKAGTPIVALLLSFCNLTSLRAQTVSGVINSYYKITAVNTVTNSITVDDATGLTPGERVLLIQCKGAAINNPNTAAFGDISAINSAGNYEFNNICTVTGNEVVLKGQLVNVYDPAGQVQLVSVPSYSSVTVSGSVSAMGWDPVTGKGGIVVIEASGTIFLNADIRVSGEGFLGGALVNYPSPYNCEWDHPVTDYYLPNPTSVFYQGGKKGEGIADYILNEEYARGKLANGGGGGNNANTGGAGGGNYGKGGDGGQRSGETFFLCHGTAPGIGGLSLAGYGYSAAANRIFLGGGGGSGHENNGFGLPGGNGGGIIILSAAVIAGGGGGLFADGLAPIATDPGYLDPTQAEGDGGGGGGAGGTVILNAATVTGAVSASAKGAKGSDASNEVSDCTGPGGGGGGGIIWAAGSVFPATVSVTANGGANGIVSLGNTKPACRGSSNGALPGGPGTALNNYTPPVAGANICVPLASTILKYFTADLEDIYGDLPDVLLSWGLYTTDDAAGIVNFTVERSDDRVHFSAMTTIAAYLDSAGYHFTDASPIEGTVLYRLVWLNDRGLRSYSRVLAVSREQDPGFGFIRLRPNPVKDVLTAELFSRSGGTAIVKIFDARGRQIASWPFSLHIGTTSLTLPVEALVPGTYFLVAEVMGRRQVRSFIKKE